MKKLTFLLVIIAFSSCTPSPPKIETDEEFLKWLSGKEFTSTGIDENHYYADGSLGSPVTTLVIQFDGDKARYKGCNPVGYNFYSTSDGYKVSFTPDCTKGDDVELNFYFEKETYWVTSYMYNFERASHMSGSAIAKLDALVNEERGSGPFMEITNSNIKIAGSKPKSVHAEVIETVLPINTDTLKNNINNNYPDLHSPEIVPIDVDLLKGVPNSPLWNGEKSFVDEDEYWRLNIGIKGDKIIIYSLPGKNNTFYLDKEEVRSVEEATIINNTIHSLDNDGVKILNAYRYLNGVFYKLNNEGIYNEYNEVDL